VPPPGYVVDHTRIRLGEGEAVFRAAKAALRRWEHFRLGWVEAWPPETPIQAGRVVAVVAPEIAPQVLERWRGLAAGEQANVIGRLADGRGRVMLETGIGGERLLEELEDDPLPRIC